MKYQWIPVLRRWWETAATVSLAAVAFAVLPQDVAAQAEVHGMVEGAFGARTARSPVHHDSQDLTLQEARAQLRLSAYGDAGEAFIRLDILNDALDQSDGTTVELREGFLRFTTLADHLDVKVGRQPLTWGTGDLVFVNDLFPKDWESFFSGREDQYLKAPSDALRLGIYGLPFDVDFVLTPEFTPDRLPAPGGRFSNQLPEGFGAPVRPTRTLDNMETALRVSRYVGNFTASLYGYHGFFKTPVGVHATAIPEIAPVPYYPELTVGGASLRGPLVGGIAWVEGGYYHSAEDSDGDDPMIENSSLRYLAGVERQMWSDFNLTLQYYGEKLADYDALVESMGGGTDRDEFKQLLTLRAEQMLRDQTVRLSLFAFLSPSDEDAHLRMLASYKVSDDVEIAVGANVFEGDSPTTTFGAFDADDNVFTRLRMSF